MGKSIRIVLNVIAKAIYILFNNFNFMMYVYMSN